jgi:hypothetical protein
MTTTQVALAKERVKRLGAAITEVTISATDGITLRGWFVQAGHTLGSTVLLLHGVTDNRLGMAGYAELLLRNGYNVLMPDARAHGESGGDIASYGLREAMDVHDWVDWLETTHPANCVFGLGESMGAAILLQSLQYENRFCTVVAESAFSDFREAAYDRVGEFLGRGPLLGQTLLRPMIESAIFYSRARYGLEFNEVSPRQAVSLAKTPVLLIHGLSDATIRPRNSLAIAVSSPDYVELWIVPGAGHCGAWSRQPQEFESRLLNWYGGKRKTVNGTATP